MGVEFFTMCRVTCDKCGIVYEITDDSIRYVVIKAEKDGWGALHGECLCPKCIEEEKPLKDKS